MAESEYLTSSEVAERLGYTIQHVRRLIRQRRLDGLKKGRDWLVSTNSVEEWASRAEYLSLPLEMDQQGAG